MWYNYIYILLLCYILGFGGGVIWIIIFFSIILVFVLIMIFICCDVYKKYYRRVLRVYDIVWYI